MMCRMQSESVIFKTAAAVDVAGDLDAEDVRAVVQAGGSAAAPDTPSAAAYARVLLLLVQGTFEDVCKCMRASTFFAFS